MEREEITLAIELFPERVRWFGVEVGPGPDAAIEFVEVMLCPVELGPASLRRGRSWRVEWRNHGRQARQAARFYPSVLTL